MRYADTVSFERDGTPVADLSRIGALEPDVGHHEEAGWTEREENEWSTLALQWVLPLE
jgi:hypothetical protein